MEYSSAIKHNEILPFATTWIELESITLSEINQLDKDNIRSHLHVEFKKQNKQREKERPRERERERERGKPRNKLLTIMNKHGYHKIGRAHV